MKPVATRFHLLAHPSTVGLFVGTLFFALALTPSLIPRPAFFQGLVSGSSFAAGYAIGVFGRWLWSYLELPDFSDRVQRHLKIAATVVCAAIMIIFLWRATEWQNSIRALMNMDPVRGVRPINVAITATLLFVSLLLLARLVRRTFHVLAERLHRFVPRRIARFVGALLTIAIIWSIINGVVLRFLLRAADSSYRQVDALVEPELSPPTDPLKTGSAESLISWDDLGTQGRSFIATGPSAADIAAIHDGPALEPIRIYIGLNAADTPEARAALALAELLRVNAFERSVLLVVTPTGSGWMDPSAHDPVEYLHRGDIATVAVQYSYLPSGLALLVDENYGNATSRALFRAVYDHWTTLPRDDRPALYLHGLSLGSLHSERSFDLHDILADPFQGVLWVGPPFRSQMWNDIVLNRQPGSPAWLPHYRDSSVVRFMNQHGGLEDPPTRWGPLRIAYLQYASDPITFFSFDSIFRRPDWLREPRGPDVSPELRWYPVVTFLQLFADMFSREEPSGFGHNYAPEHYMEAWLALTEPPGWTDEHSHRLRMHFQERELRSSP